MRTSNDDATARRPHRTLFVLLLAASAFGLLAGRPRPPAPAPFERIVLDAVDRPNGRKPKAFGDFDGDGRIDVAAQRGDGTVWYRWPDWERFPVHPTAGAGEAARAADVDRDGDVDLVFSGLYHKNEPGWFENPLAQGGDPETDPWAANPIGVAGGHGAHDLELSDIDRDGRIDVVTIGAFFFQRGTNQDPTWEIVPAASLLADRGDEGTAVGDIDRDGDADLVGASEDTPHRLLWWENPLPQGDPSATEWRQRPIGPGWDKSTVRIADVDADGRPDVVAVAMYASSGLFWFRGPSDPRAGSASWARKTVDSTVGWVHQGSILAGDFDLDDRVDLFVAEQEQSPERRLLVFYGTPEGGWIRQSLATTGGHNPALGDVDKDGDLDVLNANHGFYGADNPLELWRNERR